MPDLSLNTEQKKAIAALKRLGANWPEGIWLFCNGNCMTVLKCGPDGEHVVDSHGAADQDYAIDDINGIDHDGGRLVNEECKRVC